MAQGREKTVNNMFKTTTTMIFHKKKYKHIQTSTFIYLFFSCCYYMIFLTIFTICGSSSHAMKTEK